jgi:Flp pilus assembly protein TadD
VRLGAECQFYRGVLRWKEGAAGEALRRFRRGLQRAPEEPTLLNNVGALEALRGDVAGAAALIERALSVQPAYLDAAVNRARLAAGAGRGLIVTERLLPCTVLWGDGYDLHGAPERSDACTL